MTFEDTGTSTKPMTSRETISLGIGFIFMGVGLGLNSFGYLDTEWSLAIAGLPGGAIIAFSAGTKPVERFVCLLFYSIGFAILAGLFMWVLPTETWPEKFGAAIFILTGISMITATVNALLKLEERSKSE